MDYMTMAETLAVVPVLAKVIAAVIAVPVFFLFGVFVAYVGVYIARKFGAIKVVV